MATIRVNYTISENAKEKTDLLKKKYKMNISELVDTLINFDDKSIEKMFEIYKIFNIEKMKKYNRLQTNNGEFIFGEKLLNAVRNIPELKEIDSNKIDLAALNIHEVVEETNEKQLLEMLKNQKKLTRITADIITRYYEVADRLKKLEEKEEEKF